MSVFISLVIFLEIMEVKFFLEFLEVCGVFEIICIFFFLFKGFLRIVLGFLNVLYLIVNVIVLLIDLGCLN